MSLLELIAVADERGLAASGLACLDRCLPLLADGGEPELLRPLWGSCEDGRDWDTRLTAAREAMEGEDIADGTAALVRKMLGAAPSDWSADPLREWARACSLVALEVHRQFDIPRGGDAVQDPAGQLRRWSAGEAEDAGPLVAGELHRQIKILETLAETAGTAGSVGGLRGALDRSTEGRRVLRAVMSRRARGRA
ncbi:hypothetical protein ACFWVP_07415 [Streptomyces sp. NPDC058637]|uniref:hypothetical protein n=1 Tax=Streptomyces sp. NPDC058637 TaxID=3346569 RepID=UPI00364DFC36